MAINKKGGRTQAAGGASSSGGMSKSDTASALASAGYSESQINSALSRSESAGGLQSEVGGVAGSTTYNNDLKRWMSENQPGSDEYTALISEIMGAQIDLGQQGIGLSKENLAFQKDIGYKQLAIAEKQQKIADEKYAYWKELYQPIEKKLAGSANVGLDASYYATRAGQDVQSAFDQQRQQSERNMLRYGIDPSSPKFQALSKDLQIAEAAATAGAKTAASERVRDVNYARRSDVANLGRELPSQSAAILGAAAGTTGAAGSTVQGGYGLGLQAVGQAGTLNSSAANMALQQLQLGQNQSQFQANQAFQQQQLKAQQQAAMWNAVGGLVGTAAGAYMGFKK